MPGRGARNPVRWAKASAKKLVADCDLDSRGKREAELTTVFNDLAKQYQKYTHSDSGASAEHFHDHFVKSLGAIAKNVPPTAEQVANNAPNAVNAVNPNSTALVKANASNMNPVAINNNNMNKRPANDQDGANKRFKTEDGPAGIATSFKVDTNGPSTTRLHYPGYTCEFMFNGSGTVQVHNANVPAGPPAFVQPAAAPTSAPAIAPAPANGTGAKGRGTSTQAEGDGSPSKRPVPLDMYL